MILQRNHILNGKTFFFPPFVPFALSHTVAFSWLLNEAEGFESCVCCCCLQPYCVEMSLLMWSRGVTLSHLYIIYTLQKVIMISLSIALDFSGWIKWSASDSSIFFLEKISLHVNINLSFVFVCSVVSSTYMERYVCNSNVVWCV